MFDPEDKHDRFRKESQVKSFYAKQAMCNIKLSAEAQHLLAAFLHTHLLLFSKTFGFLFVCVFRLDFVFIDVQFLKGQSVF